MISSELINIDLSTVKISHCTRVFRTAFTEIYPPFSILRDLSVLRSEKLFDLAQKRNAAHFQNVSQFFLADLIMTGNLEKSHTYLQNTYLLQNGFYHSAENFLAFHLAQLRNKFSRKTALANFLQFFS